MEVVVALLGLAAQLAPGILTAIRGKTDAEAIESARAHLARVPALTPELEQLARERRAQMAAHDVAVLRRMLNRADLGHEERATLEAMLTARGGS